jgi:hypothetical protein
MWKFDMELIPDPDTVTWIVARGAAFGECMMDGNGFCDALRLNGSASGINPCLRYGPTVKSC